MKKFLALILALVMVLSFAACGDSKKDESSVDASTESVESTESTESTESEQTP